MRPILLILFSISSLAVFFSCKKTKMNDAAASANYSWVEEFDTLESAIKKGWVIINNSRPLGSGSWGQGSFAYSNGKVSGFPAASYTYSGNDYITCGYYCGAGVATVSAWLFTPPTMMKNGDQLVFFTRTVSDPANYPDRLQVRLNGTDAGTDIGSGPLSNNSIAESVGKYDKLLLDINPQLKKTGTDAYPAVWTRYIVTVTNTPERALRRFAFRYYVSNGGSSGTNSDAIGVDSVAFVSK